MQSILSTLRKRWKLVAGIVGAFVAIVVLVALLGRSQQARIAEELAAGLRSARIGRDELIVTASATGRLEAVSDANLAFLAPGEVAIINVKEGDVVSAGDVLASLDSASLELSLKDAELAHALQVLALEELKSDPSEAQLALAKASVSQAGAQLNLVARPPTDDEIRIAELGVELARNQLFERQSSRDLSEDRSGPGVSTAMGNQQAFGAELGVDAAELQLEQMMQGADSGTVTTAYAALVAAQARLNTLLEGASETDLAIAENQVALAGLSVEVAKDVLDDAQIRAPFDGTVAEININLGAVATPGLPVIRLVSENEYRMEVDVDEVDVARISEGQFVEIALDSLPGETVTGAVDVIAPTATDIGGIISYIVRVTLDPTEASLRAGMTATAIIAVDEVEGAILVPNWAVRIDRSTGEAFVNVRDKEGNIEEVSIEIGLRNDSFSQVLSGLKRGDEVVVSRDDGEFSLFGGGQ